MSRLTLPVEVKLQGIRIRAAISVEIHVGSTLGARFEVGSAWGRPGHGRVEAKVGLW